MAETIDVLVVDEDPDVLELTGTFLERESDSISVQTEQSANAAVELIEEREFDCVVSDFRMPEMSGLELFETVDEDQPELPFFLFSAAADSKEGKKAREAGVDGFVQKGAGTDHYSDLAELIEDAADL